MEKSRNKIKYRLEWKETEINGNEKDTNGE